MSNSAQIKIENEMRDLNGTAPNVIYTRELSSLGLTELPVDNRSYKNQIILTPTLLMENNKAKIVGLSDTTAMLGDIGLTKKELHFQPYVLEFQESNLGANNTVVPLLAEIYGRLSKQKDELALAKWNTLATIGAIITLDETFLNTVIQNLETQRLNAGINQGSWGILMAKDLKISLMNLFYTATAISVWEKFEQYMASLGVSVYISSIFSNALYIFERNQLQVAAADEPQMVVAYTDGEGKMLKNRWQFSFSNDDFILYNDNCLNKYPVIQPAGLNVQKNGDNVQKNTKQVIA